MKNKKNLDFEDAIFDGFAKKKEFEYLELPLSRQTFVLVGVLLALLATAVVGRLVFLNIAKGDFYELRSAANVHREVIIPADRGLITDRFGKVLANNTPSFSVYLDVLRALREDILEENISRVSEVLQMDSGDILAEISLINLEKRSLIRVAKGITPEQLIALRSLHLPAISIGSDSVRYYEDGPIFAHVLGYNSLSVRAGLEDFYDSWLKGVDGQEVIFQDALGKEVNRTLGNSPSAGNKLLTTLDGELQKYFYQRLKGGLDALGRDSGVGIALNPQNGEVLALISLPSFNNNFFAAAGFAKERKQLLTAVSRPLFNRAISGLYTPGSTIKPLVGLSALREKLVTPDFQIFSSGAIEIPNPYNPDQPSRFLDWKAHGWVDLHSALARSSNVYFYELGGGFEGFQGLGIERLRHYWQQFLLGQETGIDLPSESSGFLPSSEEKETRTGQIWRIGDTYNVSIGQGDLLLTPLQLINFIASIGNGGRIYQPFVVKEIIDAAGNSVVTRESSVLLDYGDWQAELAEVRQGMEDAVQKWYGTAYSLSGLPIKAAGKTGSSQVSNNTKTNAFFVGYAPSEKPEIAVLVLVENSREGSLNAVPIAKDVLEWYYNNRLAAAN